MMRRLGVLFTIVTNLHRNGFQEQHLKYLILSSVVFDFLNAHRIGLSIKKLSSPTGN